MRELIFDKAKWAFDNEGMWLSFKVENKTIAQSIVNSLKNIKYVANIKEYRQRRSLNANAYAWALINELANVMRMSKEDVYIEMLKSYGQSLIVSIQHKDIERFERTQKYWNLIADNVILNGKVFNHYKVYIGSSQYDSKEMAIFIDGLVEECKQQGIETMTLAERQLLCDKWKGQNND